MCTPGRPTCGIFMFRWMLCAAAQVIRTVAAKMNGNQPTPFRSFLLAPQTHFSCRSRSRHQRGKATPAGLQKKNILTHHASSPQYTPSRKHSTHANQFNKYTFKLNAGFYCSRFRGLARFVGLLAPARATYLVVMRLQIYRVESAPCRPRICS